MMSVKDPGSRLLKWQIKLEEYDYDIVFKTRASNTNADALSRINRLIADKVAPGEKRQQVTDEETKTTIMYQYHDSPVGAPRNE
jgi:hypothetical protein